MALVGHISGSSQSNSVIGVSGSVIIANRASSLFPALPGTDVSFFVSGSSASDMALFGGGLVSSGSVAVKNSTGISQFSADSTGITVKDSSNNSKFTVASATGNTVVQGTFQSVGAFTATGGLTATSITGSITKLNGGGDFLVAGSNITLTTGSNGSVTIAASGGGTPGGATTQIQFNNAGAFAGDAELTYNSTTDTLTGVTGSFYRVVATDEVRANGGSVTTTQTTFNLVNTTATTLNVGGAATAITMGDATSATTTVRGGTVVGNTATQNVFNTTATSVNFAGAGTDINVGAATGNLYLKNATTNVSGNIVLAGDIAVNGGDVTTSATTFNLVNATATTLNVGGAATALALGASTGTATVNNATVTLANATALNVNGANPTVASTSTGTLTLFNTNLLTANAFGAATAITMGDATSATTTIRGGTLVGNLATQNLFNTTATTLNVGGAADVNIGGSAKTVTVAGALTVNGNTTLGDATSDTITFTARAASSLLPSADVTYNLGSATNRWANIFTGDLHLRNDRGDYTLIEESDFLTIRFNKTGKRYKFVLEAVPQFDEELGNFSS